MRKLVSRYEPTAMQSLADVQEMPSMLVAVDPLGVGISCSDQPTGPSSLLPFQLTASGRRFRPTKKPTAKHLLAVGHDTPLSCSAVEPAGRGSG